MGCRGPRRHNGLPDTKIRGWAITAGARGHSLSLGALGAGVLCELRVAFGAALDQRRQSARAPGLRGMPGRVAFCRAACCQAGCCLTVRCRAESTPRASGDRATITKCCSSECVQSKHGCTSSLASSNRERSSTPDRLWSARSQWPRGLDGGAKNTCLIHPKLGSFGFLAVLLTSVEVGPEDKRAELVPDRCGSCTRCIEACPTHALDVPYQMDATRCISYLTIEHKGPIAEELAEKMGRQVFGCDICQDVCPWNGKAIRVASYTSHPTPSARLEEADASTSLRTERMGHNPIAEDAELAPRAELVNPALEWLGSLDEQSFEREFNGSPVRRTGFLGLRRNVAIAMGNSGEKRFAEQLEAWAAAADDGLREAARWAIPRLRNR